MSSRADSQFYPFSFVDFYLQLFLLIKWICFHLFQALINDQSALEPGRFQNRTCQKFQRDNKKQVILEQKSDTIPGM